MNAGFTPTADPGMPQVPRANDVYSGVRLIYGHGFEQAFLERRTLLALARVIGPCLIFAAIAVAATQLGLHLSGVLDDSDDPEALQVASSVVAFGVGFAIWSLRRQAFGIASWQVVIDGRAGVADQAVNQLQGELHRRMSGTPVRVSERRRRARWAIRVRYRTFNVYVSIFPFGSDLFIGWAMLEEPNFWEVLGGWLADLFRGGSWFRREMHSYQAKALRDVVHNATRDAVAFAGQAPRPAPASHGGPPPTSETPLPGS